MKREVRYAYLEWWSGEQHSTLRKKEQYKIKEKRSPVEKLKYRRQSRHVGPCKKNIH
jgi:hypothetical protein